MSLPFDNALQRELARVRRQREGGQHTDLAARMDSPTLSPAGVGSLSVLRDLSSMTDMAAELSRPVAVVEPVDEVTVLREQRI